MPGMNPRQLEKIFLDARKKWKGNGSGSTPEKTEKLRVAVIDLLGELGIKSVLDFGCGSDPWLAGAIPNFVAYFGVDVVGEVVKDNGIGIHLTEDSVLPRCDLVFVRDVLAHLSHATALETLQMLKRTGATWLLCSNYYGSGNTSIKDGGFRPLNLTRLPFHFCEPNQVIDEGFEKKSMALWRFDKILLDVKVPAAAPRAAARPIEIVEAPPIEVIEADESTDDHGIMY
jgi:hypothetical protein